MVNKIEAIQEKADSILQKPIPIEAKLKEEEALKLSQIRREILSEFRKLSNNMEQKPSAKKEEKMMLLNSIDAQVKERLEQIKPPTKRKLSPAMQLKEGNVANNAESYLQALKSPNLDSSNYILLSTKILEIKLGGAVKSDIDKIKKAYLEFDYDHAMNLIKKLCIDNEKMQDGKFIIRKLKDVIDAPTANPSRRYFETQLSQQLWNNQDKNAIESIGRLGTFMKEMNAQMPTPAKVTNLEEAAQVVDLTRDFGYKTPVVNKLMDELRDNPVSISQTKDRGDEKPEKLGSMNPGVMRSYMRMPHNERFVKPEMGRIVDRNTIDSQKPGYSTKRKEVPFVNSISGTTYRMVAALAKYVEKHPEEPKLQQDVNNLTRSWVGFACMNGFHSYAELMDVLKEDQVQDLFTKRNLKLNVDFTPKDILDRSFESSANYARVIGLQQQVGSDIRPDVQSRLKPLK